MLNTSQTDAHPAINLERFNLSGGLNLKNLSGNVTSSDNSENQRLGNHSFKKAPNSNLDHILKQMLKNIRGSLTAFIDANLHAPVEIGFHAKVSEQINLKQLKTNLQKCSSALNRIITDDTLQDPQSVDLRFMAQNVQALVDRFRVDLVRLHSTDTLPGSKNGMALQMILSYRQNFSALLHDLNAYLEHINKSS